MIRLQRVTQQASCEDPDGKGGLAISLSERSDSTARWRMLVYAHTDERIVRVGRLTTSPPADAADRLVAVATCPGAQHWTVLVEPVDAALVNRESQLSLSVGLPVSGGVGLYRVAPRWGYLAGAVGGVATNEGEQIDRIVAASAGGGTVTINGGAAIPVVANVPLEIAFPVGLEGPATVTFIGTDSYLIETSRSA